MNTITTANYERCAAQLEIALSGVPFYERWRSFDRGPLVPFPERMSALPVLTKKDLRAFVPHGFIQKGFSGKSAFSSGEIEMVSTSGTSSERVSIVWNQAWWDRSEREAARLHPVLDRIFQHGHREAVLTTPVCAANMCHIGEAPMQERTVGNLLFLNQAMDPTSWDDKNIRRMAEELKLFQPAIIEADPAYLAIFSRACLHSGYQLYQPECIVLTYEFPSRIHYRQINKAFPGVPVVSSYGSTETGSVFMQCEAGVFHQNMATCHVDIQPLRTEHGDSRIGRILVTTLDNPWCVLLRFDVGDMARIHTGAPCSCGRSGGLTLGSIEGRSRDITFTTDGSAVTLKQLDDALTAADGLLNYHLEQLDPQRYKIRYAAETGEEQRTADILADILHTVYGKDAFIETSPDSALPPEQSGKFRLAHTTLAFQPEELFK